MHTCAYTCDRVCTSTCVRPAKNPRELPRAQDCRLGRLPQRTGELGSPHRLMELTLGTVSPSHTPSANSRSRISQANMVGLWRL